jgi:hypothetical protein
MRVVAYVLVVLCAAGCGGDAYPAPPSDCTVALWDPDDGEFTRWPEPDILVADSTTGTGFRIEVDRDRYAPTLDAAGAFESVFVRDLEDLDGFGVNAQAFVRFSAPFDVALLPRGDSPSAADGVGLLVLEPGPPRMHPFLLTTTDEGATLLLAPMVPLPEQARVALYATRALAPAAGGCVWPSRGYHRSIHGSDADVRDAVTALEALGIVDDADDLVALTVFPTQTITDDSAAIAAHIAEQSYALAGPITCTPNEAEQWRECTGAFVASPGDAVVPSRTYTVPFVVWLPTHDGSLTPPYETLVFGHGLGGTRFQARQLARFAAPLGIATVAIDAVQHGEHPTVPEGASTDTLATVLRFFGVDLVGDDLLDALLLRDHWRQSTYDKLQLAHLLEDGLDVDTSVPGVDIDADRLAYLGVSLGGIMGPELAALTDRFGAVLLVVPGGRVSSIVSESEQFGPLIPLLGGGRPAGDVFRFFPVLQTILDRGDAASYGPHVLADRLTGSSVPPSVLVGVVLDDDTVPNVSNYTLVRALGTPVVPPVRRPYEGMVVADSAPFSGNLAGGVATAGVLQFDWVGDGEGGARVATHSNVGASDVGAEAWLQFLVSHWDDGLAVIVDPYETLGFPRPD